MTIRPDNSIPIILANIEQFNNRADIRDFLLNQWRQEASQTKYRYFVETLQNGNQIYLERPGRLNKGCDFIIFIENHLLFKNGNDKPPRHDFILNDLRLKKQNLSNQDYQNLILSITDIYDCGTVNNAVSRLLNQNTVGETYELILKVTRWFFIEQDITYWSGQGRSMLFNKILNV